MEPRNVNHSYFSIVTTVLVHKVSINIKNQSLFYALNDSSKIVNATLGSKWIWRWHNTLHIYRQYLTEMLCHISPFMVLPLHAITLKLNCRKIGSLLLQKLSFIEELRGSLSDFVVGYIERLWNQIEFSNECVCVSTCNLCDWWNNHKILFCLMPAQPKIYFTRNELLDHSINQRFSFHSVLTERHCYVQKKTFSRICG